MRSFPRMDKSHTSLHDGPFAQPAPAGEWRVWEPRLSYPFSVKLSHLPLPRIRRLPPPAAGRARRRRTRRHA